MNTCELVAIKMNQKFFTTPLGEKSKVRGQPKENLELYDCSVKFKFLPSDCFKVILLIKGTLQEFI
jgi:hypothetical protein